ncbi:bifunctional phosphoribosylaminoimidazolecarboxamide formyltransferase/IMP cyclohydrolase [Methylophilaceae bacterium]|nr:bifunctional phosphoribosylaminoimidazolecarboxamide formyltransferase/IMP cyclohydrolase [Methylophilaceae bacterium]
MKKILRALISVSDKTNIIELASLLKKYNVEIISTGGTAKLFIEHSIPVIQVSDYTGHPEILDGRVKTLHPRIHGGILGKRNDINHTETMKKNNINEIDLVIVNLYPFQSTIAREDCTLDLAIENIDIGGPTMIRAAAKNYNSVAVLTDPNDYDKFSKEFIRENGSVSSEYKFKLAKKAFMHTALYDSAISNYLTGLNQEDEELPAQLIQVMNKNLDMRYGENPHQTAAFYKEPNIVKGSLSNFIQVQGKALSFNNLNDADTAWECVKNFSEPSCVIVKHANPCGVCSANNNLLAYQGAFATDPTSSFGGIISFNKKLDEKTAELIIKQFSEVIIAPDYSKEALSVFSKKTNIRVLKVPLFENNNQLDFKKIGGGWLVQNLDKHQLNINECKVVTKLKPTPEELIEMKFAWQVAQYVKSNAIIFTKNNKTIAIGAGQMSRIDSTIIATIKAKNAGLSLSDSVVASDAFFPFRDGIDLLAKYGAKCVIQPGGSIKDDEVVKAANEHKLVMLFTNIRHFKH